MSKRPTDPFTPGDLVKIRWSVGHAGMSDPELIIFLGLEQRPLLTSFPGGRPSKYPVWHVFRNGKPEELFPLGNDLFSVMDIPSRIDDSEG